MRRDSRLSGALHLLLHMVDSQGPSTSDAMAKALRTNPVVVRRLMAGLRDHGLVRSEKGHGGGWMLVADPAATTFRDVYEALGEPGILTMGNRTDAPGCRVEQAVNEALGDAFDAAEAILLERFGTLTLAALAGAVKARPAASAHIPALEVAHEL